MKWEEDDIIEFLQNDYVRHFKNKQDFEKNDNEVDANYEDAELEVWHFGKDGSLKVSNVLEVSGTQLAELYKCIITGEKYELKTNDEWVLEELDDAEKLIAFYETLKAKAEKAAQQVREKIVDSMLKQGITKFENENLTITYVAPTTAETFDSTRFKAEQPDVYKQYTKTINKKASVRIKLKENTNE